MQTTALPQDLNANIGREKKDFAVKTTRAKSLRRSFFLIFFGIIWITITSILIFPLSKPISMLDLGSVAFALVGFWILGSGIHSIFKSGGYFVGTPTRLVNYQNGNIRSIDWKQFSGDITVNGNAKKGDITLNMKTGRMVYNDNGPDRYFPDQTYIAGIENASNIEKMCRKRIKENDSEHNIS